MLCPAELGACWFVPMFRNRAGFQRKHFKTKEHTKLSQPPTNQVTESLFRLY